MLRNGFRSPPQMQMHMKQQQPIKQEKKKQVRMSISFKDDELWLYEELSKHSCPSGWVKDILKMYYSQ
ncbi:hypothetical protein [Anaerotignum propionicum]|uniref:hypothetical protein n=1 Tax=Anaerotignum propionicum TaxID=28446 RepID=UPI00289DF578|nr:hypothetical protein [Anaerotignum propionicum]